MTVTFAADSHRWFFVRVYTRLYIYTYTRALILFYERFSRGLLDELLDFPLVIRSQRVRAPIEEKPLKRKTETRRFFIHTYR